MPDDFGAAFAHGPAAETACLGVSFLNLQIVRGRSGNGGVRGDEAGQLAFTHERQDFIKRINGEVGRDFDQDGLDLLRDACCVGDGTRNTQHFPVHLLHGGENFIQRGLVLELAEIGSVR